MGDETLPLCRIFLSAGGSTAPWPASLALEQALQGLWQTGHAAWPAIELPIEHLLTHLGQLLPSPAPPAPAEFFSGLAEADLFLACACAEGVPGAIDAFDKDVLGRVPAFLAHMGQQPSFHEEVQQMLRERILVGSAEGPPRIAAYAGLGSLSSWVRVSAVRTALNLLRDEPRTTDDFEDHAYHATTDADPEIRLLRGRYRDVFQEAVRAAVRSLPAEQRNVLHLYLVGGLSTPRIGALFDVNHSTVVRWLAAARRAILEETRRRLREQAGLSSEEFASLARLMVSQIDLSLAGLLKADNDPG